MSETPRDLVVSLSLQKDNFTRNIRSVNKQIAEAESKFKLAAAGVEGFEKTVTGLSTQLSTPAAAVPAEGRITQYERALTAANGKLQECFTRQTDCAQRLTEASVVLRFPSDKPRAAKEQQKFFRSPVFCDWAVALRSCASTDTRLGSFPCFRIGTPSRRSSPAAVSWRALRPPPAG